MEKDLFIKYLQGNCTEKEFEQLFLWIKEDSLTASGEGMVQEVWNEFEPEAGPVERMKYNRILDKIHHQINIHPNFNQLIIQRPSIRNRVLSVLTRAAAVLLIPVLSLLLYTYFLGKDQYVKSMNDLEVVAPAGSRMQFVLGDGTKVWLNHGSQLKYPYQFTGENRKVFLTGEAYFEVAHNKKMPFIVRTSSIEVKATGTAFNVSAYPGDDLVETTLVEGKVILYESTTERKIIAMSPNECLKFNSKKNVYALESGNTEKYTAWKDGILVFKNDRISDIARKLARWYNVDVEITSEKAKEFTCTATFTDETLSQVLELLTLPTPVSYKLTIREKLSDGSFSKQKVLIGLK
ncbi:MAG: FecR family protein [Prolixibacteraceae bacterium]|jgi:ferric-dicitrate binding protein FerR (iron transport regulator)